MDIFQENWKFWMHRMWYRIHSLFIFTNLPTWLSSAHVKNRKCRWKYGRQGTCWAKFWSLTNIVVVLLFIRPGLPKWIVRSNTWFHLFTFLVFEIQRRLTWYLWLHFDKLWKESTDLMASVPQSQQTFCLSKQSKQFDATKIFGYSACFRGWSNRFWNILTAFVRN